MQTARQAGRLFAGCVCRRLVHAACLAPAVAARCMRSLQAAAQCSWLPRPLPSKYTQPTGGARPAVLGLQLVGVLSKKDLKKGGQLVKVCFIRWPQPQPWGLVKVCLPGWQTAGQGVLGWVAGAGNVHGVAIWRSDTHWPGRAPAVARAGQGVHLPLLVV